MPTPVPPKYLVLNADGVPAGLPVDDQPGTLEEGQWCEIVPDGYGATMEWSPTKRGFVDIVVASPLLALVDFYFLFTQSERLAIRAARASDPILDDFWTLLEGATNGIKITHPAIAGGIAYLVTKRFLTAARAAKVSKGVQP